MLLIGITGGIAAGKTYVANIFEQLNTPVIYADNIAKELIYTDKNINNKIKQYFNILDLESNIKNIKIQVFNNKNHRLFLEKLIHPKVIERIILQIQSLKKNYCIIEIPMLHNLIQILKTININKIILISCNQNLQVSRAMHRDKLSKTQVMSIIKSQMPEKFLRNFADHILDGNELKNLYAQTVNLNKQLLL